MSRRAGLLLRGCEQRETAARSLGVVHGHVGSAQEVIDVVAVLGDERHADARPDVERVALDIEWWLERLLDLPGHRRCAGRSVLRRRTPNSSPPSRATVSPSRRQPEPYRHELEQRVADLVPERVVDLFEVVEIHHEKRQWLAGLVAIAERMIDAIAEGEPGWEGR